MADLFALIDDANRQYLRAFETNDPVEFAIADYFVKRMNWSPTFESAKKRALERIEAGEESK